MKPGGLIRVHTSALQPTSLYKSLVISEETTSDELLTLLLTSCNSNEVVEQFSIYEVSSPLARPDAPRFTNRIPLAGVS